MSKWWSHEWIWKFEIEAKEWKAGGISKAEKEGRAMAKAIALPSFSAFEIPSAFHSLALISNFWIHSSASSSTHFWRNQLHELQSFNARFPLSLLLVTTFSRPPLCLYFQQLLSLFVASFSPPPIVFPLLVPSAPSLIDYVNSLPSTCSRSCTTGFWGVVAVAMMLSVAPPANCHCHLAEDGVTSKSAQFEFFHWHPQLLLFVELLRLLLCSSQRIEQIECFPPW